MKKRSKSKRLSAVPRVDPYLEGLMAKLLERLAGLEKKMDAVIAQTKMVQSPAVNQPPRRDRVLYEAICADCHKVCEVPFRPTEVRPVYCKECFAKRKAGGAGVPNRPGMPVLTPVAMPPKPVSKLAAQPAVPPAGGKPKKATKSRLAKKAKKKK